MLTATLCLFLMQDGDDWQDRLAEDATRVLTRLAANRRWMDGIDRVWDAVPDECKVRAFRRALDTYQRLPARCRQRAFRFTMENLRNTPPGLRGDLQREVIRELLRPRPAEDREPL